ncbi:OLC1v1026327C1 [Oldenlandia corymbosa var. corymbosa]|uniref:OLC1v1026327C1 n=1 Tax=Oldenlandia corymbosa var. corymbosa TaxID=529605 RepID=A0AAV1C842_OLDCO|nr:OLC1v1026327C1 [Oldenlandia corymbosa var. corymbosa]
MHQFAYFTLAFLFYSSCTRSVIATGQFDGVKAEHHHHHHNHNHPQPQQLEQGQQNGTDNSSTKLFVFGDSYADTGNWPSTAISWKKPYGITYPGKPTGRFSDGLILTDYLASGIGIDSPVPYNKWKTLGDQKSDLQINGMNFAHGGTGVFNTLVNQPNMTTQINMFQQLVQEDEVYGTLMQDYWVALVSVAGNDYATFLAKNGSLQEVPAFTKTILSQLELNLRRIHGLGVQKVLITGMQPLGCLPQMTALNSHTNCSEAGNSLAIYHNQMLQESVQKLNNETGGSAFMILDLYSSFMSALEIVDNQAGNSTFPYQLTPCCVGSGEGYYCGSVNNLGRKKYNVCEDPTLSFFWDYIHPTQQGWEAVYFALEPSIRDLLK